MRIETICCCDVQEDCGGGGHFGLVQGDWPQGYLDFGGRGNFPRCLGFCKGCAGENRWPGQSSVKVVDGRVDIVQ